MRTFRSVILAAAGSALLAQAAFAADLGGGPRRSVKDGPYDAPYAVPFSWSGLYVGAHVGYGWSDSDWSGVGSSFDGSGWLAGGQVGINWQLSSGLVVGVEADLSSTDLSGSTGCGGLICSHNVNWLTSVRGRAGTTINGNRTLLYVTAGGAWADVDYASSPFSGFNDTHFGWVAGAGIEHMLTPNMTARVEYLYYGFDDVTAPAGALGGGAVGIDPSVQTVRFGLNFKF